MMDGANYLGAFIQRMYHNGLWSPSRGENMLDSGAHFYETYKTKDGKYISVGAIEPQFYSILVRKMGLTEADLPVQTDSGTWPEMKKKFAEIFESKTSNEWCEIFDGSDACVAPVLTFDELKSHPHAKHRNLLFDSSTGDVAPAPRLSRTPAQLNVSSELLPGQHTAQILKEFGFSACEIDALIKQRIASQTSAKL
jgi:alpha-methylacyl-CoA racemase